ASRACTRKVEGARRDESILDGTRAGQAARHRQLSEQFVAIPTQAINRKLDLHLGKRRAIAVLGLPKQRVTHGDVPTRRSACRMETWRRGTPRRIGRTARTGRGLRPEALGARR